MSKVEENEDAEDLKNDGNSLDSLFIQSDDFFDLLIRAKDEWNAIKASRRELKEYKLLLQSKECELNIQAQNLKKEKSQLCDQEKVLVDKKLLLEVEEQKLQKARLEISTHYIFLQNIHKKIAQAYETAFSSTLAHDVNLDSSSYDTPHKHHYSSIYLKDDNNYYRQKRFISTSDGGNSSRQAKTFSKSVSENGEDFKGESKTVDRKVSFDSNLSEDGAASANVKAKIGEENVHSKNFHPNLVLRFDNNNARTTKLTSTASDGYIKRDSNNNTTTFIHHENKEDGSPTPQLLHPSSSSLSSHHINASPNLSTNNSRLDSERKRYVVDLERVREEKVREERMREKKQRDEERDDEGKERENKRFKGSEVLDKFQSNQSDVINTSDYVNKDHQLSIKNYSHSSKPSSHISTVDSDVAPFFSSPSLSRQTSPSPNYTPVSDINPDPDRLSFNSNNGSSISGSAFILDGHTAATDNNEREAIDDVGISNDNRSHPNGRSHHSHSTTSSKQRSRSIGSAREGRNGVGWRGKLGEGGGEKRDEREREREWDRKRERKVEWDWERREGERDRDRDHWIREKGWKSGEKGGSKGGGDVRRDRGGGGGTAKDAGPGTGGGDRSCARDYRGRYHSTLSNGHALGSGRSGGGGGGASGDSRAWNGGGGTGRGSRENDGEAVLDEEDSEEAVEKAVLMFHTSQPQMEIQPTEEK